MLGYSGRCKNSVGRLGLQLWVDNKALINNLQHRCCSRFLEPGLNYNWTIDSRRPLGPCSKSLDSLCRLEPLLSISLNCFWSLCPSFSTNTICSIYDILCWKDRSSRHVPCACIMTYTPTPTPPPPPKQHPVSAQRGLVRMHFRYHDSLLELRSGREAVVSVLALQFRIAGSILRSSSLSNDCWWALNSNH